MPSFVEIHNAVTSTGFTALSNPLEDFLLQNLPGDYYKVWRCVWRATIGWQKLADFLSIREISKATRVAQSRVCRALHFLHLVGLLSYDPGQQGKIKSHITVVPKGLPNMAVFGPRLDDHIAALREVEHLESKLRGQGGNKNFSFTNTEFRARVQGLVHTQFALETWGDVMDCARAAPAVVG